MDDQIKIYDTVRGNQSFSYYNSAPNGYNTYNTTNSSKIKKSHWSNLFTWKKKVKTSPNSIINYPFPNIDANKPILSQKYGSVSTATGMGYTYASPPAQIQSTINYTQSAVRHSLLSTTTIHASIKTSSPNKTNRHSLFYSPWESLHDQSVNHYSQHCTCSSDAIVDNYCSAKDRHKHVKEEVSKSMTVIAVDDDSLRSKKYSRMDLYSLEEENSVQKATDFKSKSSDSIYKKNKCSSYSLKSSKSSTTLNSNPYGCEPIDRKSKALKDTSSATVNERFLRFFKKSSTDPFNSIASRKSILECEVSAYDLIKRKLKSSLLEDDIDDNLSDNAIENENNMYNVKNALNSNRKSIKQNSELIESDSNNTRSGSKNDIGIILNNSSANSIRIAGHGMNLTSKTPINSRAKYNNSANNQFNDNKIYDIAKCYSTLDSSIDTPVSSSNGSWSASSVISDESLPEPDYDIDDNDYYGMNSQSIHDLSNFKNLKLSYSPPLTNRKNYSQNDYAIYERVVAKNLTNDDYNQLNYSNNGCNNHYSGGNHDNDINNKTKNQIYKESPYSSNYSIKSIRAPPPPPCLPPPPLPPTIRKSAPKPSSMTSNMNSYQNELKDKLNSGVKSILKKTLIISDQYSVQRNINKCENDVIFDKTTSDTCDYLKAYKAFKESRLRGGRRRKHVHFKSQCDDSLIVDHIRETILEVDEIDEPIYDDVALPSSLNCVDNNSTPSLANGHKDINDVSDNQKPEEILCDSTQSTSSDRGKKSDEDNLLNKGEEAFEFIEFDPGEDPSSSSLSWMNRVDLKANQLSLGKGKDNNISGTSYKDSYRKPADIGVAVQGPKGPSKNVFPSPAANYTTTKFEQQKYSSNDTLGLPIVKRRLLPGVAHTQKTLISTSSGSAAIDVLIGDQQGKHHQYMIDQKQLPVSDSTTSSLFNNKSYSTDKSDITVNNIEKQLALPVSQGINTTYVNKNNISKTNAQLEKQTSSNTEIEISNQINIKAKPIDSCFENIGSPSYDEIKSNNYFQSNNNCIQNDNPFMCTISIKNVSNSKTDDQNDYNQNIEANVDSLSRDVMAFGPIGSSISSSSLYDSGPQSSDDSLNREKSDPINECMGPITILCSNPNDKIIINVGLDNNFDNINDHIYEELDTEPIYVDTSDSSLDNVKSIFDGASKDEILEFLEDAKERVREDILVDTNIDQEILEAIDVIQNIDDSQIINTKNIIETTVSSNRRNRTSNVSNSSTDSTATTASSIDIEDDILKCAITNSASVGQLVERNDSGVGAETSKPSRLRKLSLNDEVEHQCADCESHVDPNEDETGLLHYPLFCHRCDKKRSERKEIISEIVDTEFKYGRDLRIIREEFYRPIEIAGLLSKEQLKGVFLNLDELIAVNSKFSEKLQDAIDIATEQGDEDYTTVNIGKLFKDLSAMLHSFEFYCVRQCSAALLLNHLEKEKELLRIFLRVSQMENTLLRRMNLRSFLVVPVQRVTKYPLLLNRLYKVTPYHHRDRDALKESQQKVELHLEHINQQTKGTIGTTTRIWRRISNLSTSHRRLNNADDIGNIKIRQAALEILKWNQEETQFVTIGKVFFASITDYTVNKKAKTLKFMTSSALLVTQGRPNQNYRPDLVNTAEAERDLMFPRDNTGITDAVLLLIKEKCGRYVLFKETLHLGSCVISCDNDSDEMFEIHEQTTKDSYIFKAETLSETKDWLKQLRYHSKDLGNWRRRRNALANIMVVRQ